MLLARSPLAVFFVFLPRAIMEGGRVHEDLTAEGKVLPLWRPRFPCQLVSHSRPAYRRSLLAATRSSCGAPGRGETWSLFVVAQLPCPALVCVSLTPLVLDSTRGSRLSRTLWRGCDPTATWLKKLSGSRHAPCPHPSWNCVPCARPPTRSVTASGAVD
jgi:hypothetical protein